MSFGQPLFLYALLLVPISLLFLLWAQRRKEVAVARLGNASLIAQLSATVNRRGRQWQRWLWLLALAFTILALARPQWGSQVEVVEQEGVQVMVALDISKSMLAADLKPDRLTRAKLEISDLMNRLNGDEIGLALFSGASFIQFPLTSDYDTARAFLENANPSLISRPGTAIGAAIRTAMQGFDAKRSNQKVIVILTDGEDHEPDADAAAQEAAKQGVIIYTIGFGSAQGEPIPEFDATGKLTGYKKDANGAPVLSKLNEVALQKLALATQGHYFRASAGGEELDTLAAELDQLQKAQLESRFTLQKIERYQLFLLVAIVALLLHELIPDRLRQRGEGERRWWRGVPKTANLLVFLLIFALAGCNQPSAGQMVAQGNRAFAQAAYPTAQAAYQSAQSLDPQVAEPIYNLANTYYRQGIYSTTQTLLPQAVNLADGELAQSSYYNLGNTHFQTQQWQEAVEAYKEALRRNPADQDAKHNLELALQQLQTQQQQDQQRQEQQDQQQQDQQKQDQQQQDQQQQDQQKQDQQQQDQQQQDQQKQDQQQQDQQKQDQQKQDQQRQDQQKQDQQKQDQQRQDQQQQEQQKQDQAQQAQAGDKNDTTQPKPAENQAGQPADATTQVLSEEQARQLLNSVGQKTQTLQERLQEIYVVPGDAPEKDW